MGDSTARFSASMREGLDNLSRRLKFVMQEGHIWLDENRMILLHTAALGALRKELVDTLGLERTRGLFARMGFQSGARDAELARKLRPTASDFGLLEIGPCLHVLEGNVRVTPIDVHIDIAKGEYYGDHLWEDSFEAEVHRHLFGVGDEPVCWMQVGYASGYTSSLMGRTILYKETECVGCGDRNCRIVGKPVEDWPDGEEMLKLYQPDPLFDTLLQLQSEVESLRSMQDDTGQPEDLVGISDGFIEAWRLAQRAAPSDVTVLLLGETGVGKERFARGLHHVSRRRDKPFVAINCAAMAEELIEAELFGVERGAFTGAHQSRPGRFERADGGTLFLDEVGELSANAQAKLLRVLQEGEFERVGDTHVRRVNVRVVAATNVDLNDAVRRGTFRKDLLYRLNVYPVTIPPLRERCDDIPLLVERFIAKYSARHGKRVLGLTDRAITTLRAYTWPGNVRELENVVERGVILAAPGVRITECDLFASPPAEVECDTASLDASGRPLRQNASAADALFDHMAREGIPLDRIENMLIETAVERAAGNLSQAARMLGITRPQLAYRWRNRDKASASADE
ncbi:Transcriptional regulatory protein XylR [Paraburkholderia piptadeniae]|uniref:Transcriptional regulatory protein XylR n=1 Tax=Paraburkholderia piptadeniae TaxID=1701573 RepID=A0A1N7SGV4_9BURK|nr:sigma-54-dependent Fis family transcriptional regulator [Paraburkholderia piptadeniae]SIT46502.1 Transcriptional regulatory protein XylR [Paraburkholderia piptadeniae]